MRTDSMEARPAFYLDFEFLLVEPFFVLGAASHVGSPPSFPPNLFAHFQYEIEPKWELGLPRMGREDVMLSRRYRTA